jgi:hypothetical protein
MKKTLILLFAIFVSIIMNAQNINTNYVGVHIDTVYLFSPFGFVSTINHNQRQTSPEFTKSIGDTLKRLILEQFPATSIVINDSMLNNDYKTQDNIIVTMDKIRKLNDDIFPMIPTGGDLDSIINKYPGRYYGFMYYSGFMNNQVKRSMATSITLMVVTTVLTAGMFTMFLIPLPSEIDAKFLIVDKKEHKYVYYCDKIQTKSFTMNVNNHKLINKLLRKYKKTFVQK